MARMKQTPVKSSRSSKNDRKSTRERRKPTKRGTTDFGSVSNTKKKQRTRANTKSKASTAKEKRTSKANKNKEYLPPELRQAGLLAHQSITKGKCFGPYRGQFVRPSKETIDDHVFVCKVKGVDKLVYDFYIHDNDKDRCMWLQRLQSAASKKQQNMVAYKSAVGVCYEATDDINPGQELLVLYDDTYGGKRYPAYVENIPIHFVSSTGELQVVPLYERNTGIPQEESINEQSTEITNEDTGKNSKGDKGDDDNDGVDNHDVDIDGNADGVDVDNDGDDDVDNDGDVEDDDDDDDYDGGGDEVDDGDVDDDDYCDDGDGDEVDDNNDIDYDGEDSDNTVEEVDSKPSKKKKRREKKPKVPKKAVIQVYELKTINLDDNTETIKYQCSYCAAIHPDKETADEHLTSNVCKDQVFTCDKCDAALESKLMESLHSCQTTYKCSVCDMEFSSSKELIKHTRGTVNDANHKIRCTECDCDFEIMKDKTDHLYAKHTKDTHDCPVCSKKYTNMQYLKEHIQSHCIDAFKCPECQKQFSSRSNLHKHIRKHSPDYIPAKDKRRHDSTIKRHECQQCGKKFDSPHGLEVHIRSHTGERPYECELCNWKFSQKPHLRRHMNTVHSTEVAKPKVAKPPPPAELPKTCELCNKVYANTRVLRVHIQSVHQKERPHKCNHCDATFTQKGHLWRHKHTFHVDSEEVQKKIKLAGCVCKVEECKQAFPCQSDLLNHMSTAHNTKWPFICDKCDASFANSSNLRKHTRRRHAEEEGLEKPFNCETCNKEFNSMYKLTQHKRSHTGEKEFKCDLCEQTFVQKSGLRKHIRCKRCPKIEGDPVQLSKKYECEECSRVFPGPSDLKSHSRSHTGEKPFECNECHKRFSQTGNLSKHVKYIHQKVQRPKDKPREKKFYCSLCGKAFACPSSLAMHCRTHTGNKPFKCDKCEAAFAQLGNLKKHLRRWHEHDGASAPKRRRKKKTTETETTTVSEGLVNNDIPMETSVDNEAEKSQGENENSNIDKESAGQEVSTQSTIDERDRAEQTAIASILTSINADQTFVSTRAFTPLNTPTQGFFISPFTAAPPTLSPSFPRGSIIMSSIGPGASGQMQIPQSTNSIETSNPFTRPNQVLVPPQLSAFVSPTVTVPQTASQGASDGTPTITTMLPHVNTILGPQINHAHYVPHGNQVQDVPFPFSTSALFQH